MPVYFWNFNFGARYDNFKIVHFTRTEVLLSNLILNGLYTTAYYSNSIPLPPYQHLPSASSKFVLLVVTRQLKNKRVKYYYQT